MNSFNNSPVTPKFPGGMPNEQLAQNAQFQQFGDSLRSNGWFSGFAKPSDSLVAKPKQGPNSPQPSQMQVVEQQQAPQPQTSQTPQMPQVQSDRGSKQPRSPWS